MENNRGYLCLGMALMEQMLSASRVSNKERDQT